MSKAIIQITKSAHERFSYLAKHHNTKDIFFSVKMIQNNKFSRKSFLFKKYFQVHVIGFQFELLRWVIKINSLHSKIKMLTLYDMSISYAS